MKKFKISIRLFIITFIMLLFINCSVFATTGKSTGDTVRIRQSPSTDAEVIDLLALDETVEILGTEGDWYKVSFKGNTGYVSKSFISTSGNTETNVDENTNETNSNENNNTQNSNQQNTEANSNEANNNVTNNNGTSNDGVDNNEANSNEADSSQSADNLSNASDNSSNVTNTIPTRKIYKLAEDSQVNILPLISSEAIGDVKEGDSVTLIGCAGVWAYVKSGDVKGWLKLDKLSTEGVQEVTDNEMSEDDKDTTDSTKNTEKENLDDELVVKVDAKTMYTSAVAVNLRSQANTSSNVVDSLGINAQVTVVGEINEWYKVEENGYTGYIRKDLLSNDKTEVTSRDNAFDRSAESSATVVADTVEQNTTVNTNTEVISENSASDEVPVSSSGVSGNDIVAYAQQFVGCSYVYGAAGPYSFDCSGLTMYVYQHFGYSLSHSSKVQATQGVAVTGDLQPGDILVFSNDGRTVGHVGIYIGNDKFIHASDSTTGVIISNLSDRWNISKYWGARRIL